MRIRWVDSSLKGDSIGDRAMTLGKRGRENISGKHKEERKVESPKPEMTSDTGKKKIVRGSEERQSVCLL